MAGPESEKQINIPAIKDVNKKNIDRKYKTIFKTFSKTI